MGAEVTGKAVEDSTLLFPLKTDRITRDLICLCESEAASAAYQITLLIIFSVSFDL